MKDKKAETTLVHEFWCCKKELNSFLYSESLLLSGMGKDEIRIACFTSYGNYLRHLYSFFEGIIEQRNSELLIDIPRKKHGEAISKLLTAEVKKLIRNKLVVLSRNSNTAAPAIDEKFGSYMRHFRNWFSHTDCRRTGDGHISLFEFYQKFHYFTLVLFESADFTWSVKSNYDWEMVRDFSEGLINRDRQ